SRFVIEPLHIADGNQLAEVPVTFPVHRQENEMVVVFLWPLVDAFLFEPTGGRDIDLAADDRLDALFHRFAIKFNGAEHVAMAGDGPGRCLWRFDVWKS